MSKEDEQTTDLDDEENGDKSSTQGKDGKSAGSGSDGENSKKGYVTEESYKGLQRTAEKQKTKLETELAQLRQKLETQAEELEEAKLAAVEKATLEKAQADLNTSIANLQAEKDKLSRQLNHQKIILAEYPDLAPLAAFIPPADTDEDFKKNAADFQTALKQFLKLTVKGDLEGAAPPIGSGNGSTDATETDKLWDEVYKYAGIPGKENEYQTAYAKLQEALKTQK